MSTDAPARTGASLSAGRLTHDQAVPLLDVVAHLVVSTASSVDPPPPTPSRMAALVTAMEAVGIDEAVIHAYRQTGILVGEGDDDLWSGDDLRRWEASLTGYRRRPPASE
jgi:hypothetical protein